MNEERIVNIEAKIAYQDNTLQELNDVIYRQQKQIDQLEAICQHRCHAAEPRSHPAPGGTL